jgi:protoheme IX farnesyltransferase
LKLELTLPRTSSLVTAGINDLAQLTRPRLALLVLVTTAVGWLLAANTQRDWDSFALVLSGTALLFAGASALNQLIERYSDALMARTANRPLPAGRIQPWMALVIGCVLVAGGLFVLLATRQRLAAGLGVFALIAYVGVYTPLKTRTTLNTLIGAVPGAVPPLMGWAAARGRLDAGAVALFLIVFLWQIPHFLAIAWIYRDEYGRAGVQMLPVHDWDGKRTGREMIRYTAALVLASLLPCVLGFGAWPTGLGALALGGIFLSSVVTFARAPTQDNARHVFRTSLLFLPALLMLSVLDATLLSGR